MAKQVSVIKVPSSHPELMEDEKLPWTYSVSGFKNWVWEVLLNCGKAGKYPRNLEQALSVAENHGYGVTVLYPTLVHTVTIRLPVKKSGLIDENLAIIQATDAVREYIHSRQNVR